MLSMKVLFVYLSTSVVICSLFEIITNMRRIASPATPNQGRETRTDTAAQSLVLVRNLVRLGISTICYLRNIFPENCFEDKEFCGMRAKGLLKTNSDTTDLCNWIEEGAFDALNKKYMQSLQFGIYSNANSEPVEVYTFTVGFLNGEARLNFEHNGKQFFARAPRSRAEVKSACVRLLRTIFTVTSCLEDLPDHHLGFVIKYNDSTPENYEPKYFRAVAKEDKLAFTQKPTKIDLGSMDDGNMRLNLILQTIIKFKEDADMEDALNDTPSDFSSQSSQASPSVQAIPGQNSKQDEEQSISPPLDESPLEKETPTNKKNANKKTKSTKPKDNKNDDEIYEKVKEAAINGVPTKTFVSGMFPDLPEEQISSFFDRMALTDKVLKVVDGNYKAQDEDPQFIRALSFVLERSTVTQYALRQNLNIDATTANAILQQMEERGVLQKGSKNKARVVIKNDRNKLLLSAIKDILAKEIVSDSESSSSQISNNQETEIFEAQPSSQSSSSSQIDDVPTNFAFSIFNEPHKKFRREEPRESPTQNTVKMFGQKLQFLNSQDSDSSSNNTKYDYHSSVIGDGKKSSLVKKRRWEQ